MFILINKVYAYTGNVLNSGSQSHCICNIAGTCFKTRRRLVIGCMFKSYIPDHIATTLPGLHFVEQGFFSIQYPNTCWTENLMSGEYIPVAIQILHIGTQMRYSLCAIYQYFSTG